ncbi:hypothetical protein GCM10023210_24650 [Chryseobacterium ginsengisoli]|uniref:Uncharacterized protein n=1 Tax=Chryseobacterium ginsengisoli TaxID=363853 RepID=A0ABP9MA96_9FLAO
MRFYLFFLFFCAQIFAFGQNTSKEDSIKIKREVEIKQRVQEILKYRKEQCSKDSLKAVEEAKTVNKYFINIVSPNGSDFPAKKGLESYLKNIGIIWGGTWMGNCFGTYSYNACYYQYMNQLTEEKFGKELIDGLVKKSLLDYIDKEPSAIFKYNDNFDLLYDENDFSGDKLINNYFFKDFTYPKGYEASKEKNQSFTEVELDFNDDTQKLSVENFKHHIDNNHNKQFIPYFEKKIRNFIKSRNFVNIEHSRYEVKTYFKIYYK